MVPPTYTRARLIRDVGIEKELESGVFDAASIWYRSDQGFVNIGYFDATDNTLYRVALHEPDAAFQVGRLIEVPRAVWNEGGWSMEGGVVTTFVEQGDPAIRDAVPGDLSSRRDAARAAQQAAAIVRVQLSRARAGRSRACKRKGLDATEYLVDMQYKLAVPFSGLVAIVIGVPLRDALRHGAAAACCAT